VPFSKRVVAAPMMPVRGVRKSCETARKRLLRIFSFSVSRRISCAFFRACCLCSARIVCEIMTLMKLKVSSIRSLVSSKRNDREVGSLTVLRTVFDFRADGILRIIGSLCNLLFQKAIQNPFILISQGTDRLLERL